MPFVISIHRTRAFRRIAAPLALVACLAGIRGESHAQTYRTILDSSESQTPQGVRAAAGSEVVLACSYTPSGGLTQGMWWKGSLTTGSGVTYKVTPSIGGQTVTSALYYGPNTPEYDPALGAGDVRIVGSYQYAGSTQVNNGVLYTGPISGTGGTWTQINVPDAATSGTVANTIPHSVMGSIAVGNYDLVVGGTSSALGNAFLYNIVSGSWTIFDAAFGGTDKLTSAYGIWQNGVGSTSYTIAGGSKDAGLDKAYLIDYDSATGLFSRLTFFTAGSPAGLTHFEGITGTPTGYNVIGISGTGYAFASIDRLPNGSFGSASWRGPLSYPGSTMTTGNTVVDSMAIGIYTLPSDSTIYAYVATVPEPATATLLLGGVVVIAGVSRKRHRVAAAG
jgi:hypothetical protein